MVTVIVAMLVFTLIVVVHEGGHFLAARMSGIKVEEFAVGMGPLVAGKKKGETLFSLRAFPIGGFCKMMGEDEENKDPRAFNNKPVASRMAAIAAGPALNLILAVLLFSLVITPVAAPIVGQATKDKPAAKAGITTGDTIVEINGTPIEKWDQIRSNISKHQGAEVSILLENKGVTRTVKVTPEKTTEPNQFVIGIVPTTKITGFSLTQGVKTTAFITDAMFQVLGKLITGKASSQDVSGPIGIVKELNDAAKTGIWQVIFLTALISLNLAIFNLLPIPALDGGRLIFLLLELIRRKPIAAEKEGMVHFIGFVALMVLMVFMVYMDAVKYNLINFFR